MQQTEVLETVEVDALRAIRVRVEAVLAEDSDPGGDRERAHSDQDAMYEEVLRRVRDGHSDARALATEVLRIADSNPTRWFA